jgi:hypothetical protein
MIARQEIALEAKKIFHSCMLMSFNTESEQDPILSRKIGNRRETWEAVMCLQEKPHGKELLRQAGCKLDAV